MPSDKKLTEISVPKERAVFWMDRFGHWYNEGGRFEHKKIIAYFNASIRKDAQGYFVEQIRGDLREKVYFNYEDTPLFVVDACVIGEQIQLMLNTRETLTLEADSLFIRQDNLYMQRDDQRIKFSDRVLLKLADRVEYDGNQYYIATSTGRFPIPEK
jgi:hypothetical protein